MKLNREIRWCIYGIPQMKKYIKDLTQKSNSSQTTASHVKHVKV